ncbi:quinol oxidase subunit 2 [Acidianus sp. RZ1]|uniref:quinol oxidase subunit 2 n=1 Tax=Acidianus sp. RZ1 TaxID=1540082 RepID=UPI0014912865|nr:quinol oxidase subunit 2 [Acidianus sp. RZ1]NON63634.1 quinol oxidase subunit 2 [Acidianus sp. RZ1]
MASKRQLSRTDYASWLSTVLAFFLLFLWIGDFGNLAYLTKSPITSYVETLWRITYIAGGGVFAVFMGSLVFLSVRFRETTPKQVNPEKVLMFSMGLDLSVLASITYIMLTIPLSQFTLGLLGSMIMLLFSIIIYLVYKIYFPS